MTPNAVFARVVGRNSLLSKRFRRLTLEARHVLLEILKLIADSPERGVYRPDPEDGPDPLPALLAEAMGATGYEDTIREQLAILARLEFLSITNDAIVIDLSTRRAMNANAPGYLSPEERSRINAANGRQGGRPPKKRVDQQGSLMLPVDGGRGPIPYGSAEVGETLAQQLRSELRVAPAPNPETKISELETETGNLETKTETEFGSGLACGSVSPPVEEEEDSNREPSKQELIVESSSSSARVDAPAETKTKTKSETENQKPKAETEKRQAPIASISPEAVRLAQRATTRWGWKDNNLPMAQRAFQDRLQEGWTVGQIESAIDSDRSVQHPGLYKKVLPQLFGAPGQAEAAPLQRPDTRNYPPDLGGEWTESFARIRYRLQQVMGEAEYRGWLGNARFTAFDDEDGELTIWVDKSFAASKLRNDEGDRMLRIIKAIVPKVLRIAFTAPALARTG